ncbi:hypothetical protein [Sutcliffiella horikoshii]|uniref:hypothetical protein n=1 Tax=Sutcliffiella horikoshii TaxID=79883 RepID=UPI001F3CBD24|nr:hypothetical protein [Sutcliffiella horikoshii]MCG1021436.1 hypothetical protein [Sutcliffiella horikoshii]
MNKQELQQTLDNENVPCDLYNLNGGLPNEAFCLNKNQNTWEVYYSERGLRTQIKRFRSEEEACDYFYKTVLENCKY